MSTIAQLVDPKAKACVNLGEEKWKKGALKYVQRAWRSRKAVELKKELNVDNGKKIDVGQAPLDPLRTITNSITNTITNHVVTNNEAMANRTSNITITNNNTVNTF